MQQETEQPDAPADEPSVDEANVDEAKVDEPQADEPQVDEAAPQEGEGAEPEQAEAEADAKGKKAKGKKAKSGEKAKKEKRPAWTPPPPERLEGAVEAILLVAGDVVRFERLRDLLGLQSVLPVKETVAAVQQRWTDAGLAMELEEVAGGVRVVTRPEYAEYVGRMMRRPVSDKLSKTQLETLSIVAYKQPVGRAEVERIRGVQAGEPLRALLERRLIKVTGRSDQPGRPLLYGTTQLFLTAFGLKDVKDLPSAKDLKRL